MNVFDDYAYTADETLDTALILNLNFVIPIVENSFLGKRNQCIIN